MGFSFSSRNFNFAPPVCPRCHRHITAEVNSASLAILDGEAELAFSCPGCERLFIATYEAGGMRNGYGYYCFVTAAPETPQPAFFREIELISSDFTQLYNEAGAAESHGLVSIAGLGYRKAFEFLVKDYCIAKFPDDRDKIATMFLGNVISSYLKDESFKQAAEMSAWLGNDEAHYSRRHDLDINDLKALLEIAISGIEQAIKLEDYARKLKPNDPRKLTFLKEQNA